MKVAFIGSVGIPNVYGGFESFLETCAPYMAKKLDRVIVTCDSNKYVNQEKFYEDVERIFIPISATGWQSTFHDFYAFLLVLMKVDKVVVLGVSAGPFFLIMRLLCFVFNKEIIVNIDGVEWRRNKFGLLKKMALRLFDFFAQVFANKIVIDNKGLEEYVISFSKSKFEVIAYPGEHVLKYKKENSITKGLALTICRIEPENNLEIIIEGVMCCDSIEKYEIIGNWSHSDYSRNLKSQIGMNFSGKVKAVDAIYDPNVIGDFRSKCEFYLHGHSVGGTNPSLVEMMYFDAKILAYDCIFNRNTAGPRAMYFSSAEEIGAVLCESGSKDYEIDDFTNIYSVEKICNKYLKFIGG